MIAPGPIILKAFRQVFFLSFFKGEKPRLVVSFVVCFLATE